MNNNSRHLAVLATFAAVVAPMTAAQAQYYGGTSQPAPLYPYAVQNSYAVSRGQPYAVEVAPNTYVIQRPAAHPSRNYPYAGGRRAAKPAPQKTTRKFDRPPKPVDHALVEELRNRVPAGEQADRAPKKGGVINTVKIVRDRPIVVETQRVVDDPPRIIDRHQVVEDPPSGSTGGPVVVEEAPPVQPGRRGDTKRRVIAADAEVTILGPDRMSIQLFRKGEGPRARARAD